MSRLRDAINKSTYVWALTYVRLPKGKWEDRPWQIVIMDDPAKMIVAKKPSQVGLTTIMLCKVFHFMEKYPVRVMYTLPRKDDVTDLVGAKLDPMIAASPHMKMNIGAVDSVRTKQYARSFIHFSEASVPPRMLDVDMLAHDEVDLSDQDYLEQYKGRLSDSNFKYRYMFSTPSVTGYGIDAEYSKSDQKQWYIKCSHCNRWQVTDWGGTMKISHGVPYFGCRYCDGILSKDDISGGRWVAEYPKREISGYRVTPFMGKWTPDALYQEYLETERLKNFYNLILGEAYTASVRSMSLDMFRNNCFTEPYDEEFEGSGYYMGVDQGNDLYVLIGKLESGVLKVVHGESVKFEEDEGFNRLDKLMKKYGIRYAIIDALPNRHSARDFMSRHKGKVGLAIYSALSSAFVINEDTGLVNIERTEAFDALRDDISSGKIRFWGERPDGLVLNIIEHCTNLRRDEETRKVAGGERIVGVWRKVGPDHYAHTLSYLRIAAQSSAPRRKARFDVVRY